MASPQTMARHFVRQPSPSPLMPSHPKNSSFAWMKHGIGHLTATVDAGKTRLTRVSHKAPMRWLPLLNCSRVEEAGAAIASMSNYGAGLLPGDTQEIHLQVNPRARLGILSQGSNRIYKQRTNNNNGEDIIATAKSTLQARVEEGGFLVVAPDPTACFATSSFVQQQHLVVHPNSSAILLDWFSSGRFANGERWQATQCSSQTTLSIMGGSQDEGQQDDNGPPLVWDATTLDQRQFSDNQYPQNPFGFDLGHQSFNAYASMLLYGEQSMPVVEQLLSLQHHLAGDFTRLRQFVGTNNDTTTDATVPPPLELGTIGRVLLGVNQLQVAPAPRHDSTPLGPVYLARWVASSNEDLYRVLHQSLKPLSSVFGIEFYKERIRAASSGPSFHHHGNDNTSHGNQQVFVPSAAGVTNKEMPTTASTAATSSSASSSTTRISTSNHPMASWNAYMLADSALPTGSFAHSSGLEAASQLGLLESNSNNNNSNSNQDEGAEREEGNDLENVQTYIQASTRSTLQQSTPWILAGHDLMQRFLQQVDVDHTGTDTNDELSSISGFVQEWERLDRQAHSVMVCSAPACRASLDQGRNSLRVALPWFQQSSPRAFHLIQAIQKQLENKSNSNNTSTSGHLGPLFGIMGAALELEAQETCQLLGYCVARDVVSAAVRLNLIGPLASVGILSKAQSGAKEGIHTSLEHLSGNSLKEGELASRGPLLGGCAPIVEAIHPCHDLLAVRLFRT